jgi:predicted Zn-dependent protease
LRAPVKILVLLTGFFAGFYQPLGHTQALVLDEEFNQFSQNLAKPLRPSLVPDRQVHYVLVNDPAINAFVTPENLVYLHSGLVLQAKSAAELQGVIAHELGHLAAGHLTTRDVAARNALIPALAGAVLGVGAAVAGAPQVAVAAAMGGQALGIQSFLNYSRVQEGEADQRALQALHAAGLSGAGMTGLFTTLRTQSQLSYDAPPPWLVTHPLPAERLARLTASVAEESPKLQTTSQAQEAKLNWSRVQAKVAALTLAPAAVLRRYPGNAPEARYARSLALLRQGKLAEAQALLTPLRQATPADPYYTEAAAQIALAQSDLPAAAKLLQQALAQVPNGLLLRFQLAEVLRAQGQPQAATREYQTITRAWPIWSEPWEGLGRTLGQQGQLAPSHLALAEGALANGDVVRAKQSLALAQNYLKQTPNADAQAWAEGLENRLKN